MLKISMHRFFFFLFFLMLPTTASAVEPVMSDYAHVPIFMVESVKPNIMVLLDNSGSMNFNAYGTERSYGNLVGDDYFGYPFQNLFLTATSDAEEEKSDGETRASHTDLDFGMSNVSSYPNQAIGVRFSSVYIPQGATITNAYIQFTATVDNSSSATTMNVEITGNDVADAEAFVSGATNADVTGRTTTSSSVSWAMSAWTYDVAVSDSDGDGFLDTGDGIPETYSTPAVTAIVQEIVNRDDWKEGNSMAFMFDTISDPEGNFRSAYSIEGDTSADDSWAPKLIIEIDQSSSKEYYGYFNPEYFYTWNSNKFIHKYKKGEFSYPDWTVTDLSTGSTVTLDSADFSSEGLWDGNWMNWMTMRRIDVLRKVLMGGLATSRTGGGNQVVYGESPPASQSIRYFDRIFNSSTIPVTPYIGSYRYRVREDDLLVDSNSSGDFTNADDKMRIAVDKVEAYDSDDFADDHNLTGIFQEYYDKAYWALEFFNKGSGTNGSGGSVVRTMDDGGMTDLLTQLQNKNCDTNTPLAESFYVAMQYYKQEDADEALEYPNGAAPHANDADDPYLRDGETVACAKSFVLLLTDGASTRDSKIPDIYKDYDGDGDATSCNEDDGSTSCDYASGGTDFLDDIALYARTNDLRDDIADDQNIILYNVFALSDDDAARQLLMDASRNGGFDDHNNNGYPDGDYSDPAEDRLEWDRNGDAVPDTYFEATDGAKLKDELSRAIEEILRRAASGTAVSVISTSTEGDGSLVQAFFRPVVEEGDESATWTGYLQSLWVDSKGNIREDTNGNHSLDLNVDRIVEYTEKENKTIANLYDVSSNAYPELIDSNIDDTVNFDDVAGIWKAGELLASRSPDTRAIFTFLDTDANQMIDSGEIVDFTSANVASIAPYLGVSAADWDYLGENAGDRADNLIEFIRGNDSGFTGDTNIRNRTIDGVTWKLGDIVYSTPVIVAAPQERYDQIYADSSYAEFYAKFKNRETIIYAGANDGMLHAFTSWYYDATAMEFTNVLPAIGDDTSSATTSDGLGKELWAYIPQSLLPHLKWLADPDYSHVHYVDLTAKVFDAKILPDNKHYTDSDSDPNWGTFLLVGLNYGGKHIWAEGDFGSGTETRHFYPTYTMIDVTDPRNPEVLWERTYSIPSSPTTNASNDTDLGLTMQLPAIVKVNSEWFTIFGSGPNDYDGESLRNGHVFVVDLATGTPFKNGTNDWLFETTNPRAMLSQASSFDKNLNFSVDSIFLGDSYDSDSGSGLTWEGGLYKIRVPWSCDSICSYYGDIDNGSYDDDPATWTISKIFNSSWPITSAPVLSVDENDNSWIYFGTGRYFTEDDKTSIDTEYLIGIKDPFFDYYAADSATYYLDTSTSKNIDDADLFYSNDYGVSSKGVVYEMPGETIWGSFNQLLDEVGDYPGWRRALVNTVGERVLSKSSIVGGTLISTSFAPASAICSYGGTSYLYGLYYLTGTAYKKAIFDDDSVSIGSGDDAGIANIVSVSLGSGLASSPTVHIGRQDGNEVTVLYQKSTGEVGRLNVEPALQVRSGLKLWREERAE